MQEFMREYIRRRIFFNFIKDFYSIPSIHFETNGAIATPIRIVLNMSSTLVISLGIAQQVLIRYIDLVVFVLGTFGSLMNILLYSQKNLRSNSCCICK